MSKKSEIVYASAMTDRVKYLGQGRTFANARFFDGKVAPGMNKAIVVGCWPDVVEAYRKAGVLVEVIDGPKLAGEPARQTAAAPAGDLESAASVDIPQDWRGLPWLERRLLAQRISGGPVINSQQAEEAIGGEVARRAGASVGIPDAIAPEEPSPEVA